jgi:NAD(P)-dependent dehydrogenase (short-subunit alcohol dehydrogenase family)
MSTQSPNIPFDANEFDGKRVLVTGGTKGIGEAIVTRLLGGGAAVLAAARTVPADGNSKQMSVRVPEPIISLVQLSTGSADSTF